MHHVWRRVHHPARDDLRSLANLEAEAALETAVGLRAGRCWHPRSSQEGAHRRELTGRCSQEGAHRRVFTGGCTRRRGKSRGKRGEARPRNDPRAHVGPDRGVSLPSPAPPPNGPDVKRDAPA